MTWLECIGALLQIILLILSAWKETNDATKKAKSDAIAEITKAVINRDAYAYVATLERISRMR